MICMTRYAIVFGGKIEPIKEWQTWWLTPEGLAQTYNEAVKIMDENSLPVNMVRPVPVAISETLSEISLR